MDRDGALAAAGVADEALLGRWLAHPFFARVGPKSLDRLDFARVLDGVNHLSAADGAATLAHFTAAAVAATRLPEPPRRWLVCGGGRRNPAIMAALRAGRSGRCGRLERRCAGGAVFRLPRRPRRGRPAAQPAGDDRRAPADAGGAHRPAGVINSLP
jgi:hypothetical protein